MATFPTLNPSTRIYTPGVYPHTAFTGFSGKQNRVRNGSVMLASQLRLTFFAVTESEMLSILSHYQGQQGTFKSFGLPSIIWSGLVSADYQLAGYGWVYKEPPTVEDSMCGDFYSVDVLFETVPPEGTSITGLDSTVFALFSPGVALAVNSQTLSVQWSLIAGVSGASGLAETVSLSLSPGTASGGVTAPGASLLVMLSIFGAIQQQTGLAQTVSASLAPGAATADDSFISSVSMLLHFDGSNNSTTFTDSSSTPLTPIVFGQTKISTTQSKYGGASGYFDGNGDYLRYTYNNDFDLLGGSFTVECWVYPEQFKDGMRIAAAGGGSAFFNSTNGIHWRMTFTTDGALRLEVRNSSGNGTVTSTATASVNTWTHVAVCVSGSTGYVAVNGTVASGSLGTIQRPSTDPVLNIATQNDGASGTSTTAFQGYIDEFRITKAARYTANYSVPTQAFPNP